MKKINKRNILAIILAVAMLIPSLLMFQTQDVHAAASVLYCAHVQGIGWQANKYNGATAGTTGQSRRVEAMKVSLSGVSGGVSYRAHVQGIGWQGWKQSGQVAGTTGQSRRVEAIQVQLTGNAAKSYDIYYRSHIQSIGWTNWAKNGQVSGSTGMSKRMEAFEIKLVAKNAKAPAGSGQASYSVQRRNIFIGDSRTCCICNEINKTKAWTNGSTVNGWYGTDYFAATWGGSNRSSTSGNAINQICDYSNVFVLLGRNETSVPGQTSSYLSRVMAKANTRRGVKVYFCYCGPDINANGSYNVNQFASYNNNVNCSGVTKLNPWGSIGKLVASWPGHYDLHYNGATSRNWYNWLKQKAPQFQ